MNKTLSNKVHIHTLFLLCTPWVIHNWTLGLTTFYQFCFCFCFKRRSTKLLFFLKTMGHNTFCANLLVFYITMWPERSKDVLGVLSEPDTLLSLSSLLIYTVSFVVSTDTIWKQMLYSKGFLTIPPPPFFFSYSFAVIKVKVKIQWPQRQWTHVFKYSRPPFIFLQPQRKCYFITSLRGRVWWDGISIQVFYSIFLSFNISLSCFLYLKENKVNNLETIWL